MYDGQEAFLSDRCPAVYVYIFLYDPSHGKDFPILCITNLNTGACSTGMYDLAVSDIDRHMAGIAYNIARLCVGVRHLRPHIAQFP